MKSQRIFLTPVPDAESMREREAEMYFQRRDRMNFKEGFVAGIVATAFILISIVAIVGFFMWSI